MFKMVLLVLLGTIPCTMLLAQHKKRASRYKWEWQVGTGVGINYSTTSLQKGLPTDHLIDYSDKTLHVQVYSVGVLFHPHWGFEFAFGVNNPLDKPDRKQLFEDALRQEYGDRFYVNPGNNPGYGGFGNRGTLRAMAGITYRWEKNHFLFYPKLSLGSTTVNTFYHLSYLKEKGTHNYQQLSFTEKGYKANNPLTVGLSATAGYRIFPWLLLQAEVKGSYLRPNIQFNKTIRDIETPQLLSSETIVYKKPIFTLTPQIGLALCFKPNPVKTGTQKAPANKRDKRH